MGRSIRLLIACAFAIVLVAVCTIAVVSAQASGPPAPTPEVAALRAQLDTMREYHDRLLTIVLWSLGVVFTIALALAAFSWWANKTNYDRDRAALTQERETLRHELRALVSDEIRRVSEETTKALGDRQAAIQQTVHQAVEKALTAKITKLTETVNGWAAATLELQADALKRDAEEAVRDKRYTWALYQYGRFIGVSVERKADHYEVDPALDEMKKILDNPDVRLDASDVTNTVMALSALPKQYHAAAEGLIQRAKAKQQ